MPAAANTDPPEVVIPDCCNTGVILRVLAAVNLVVIVGILMQHRDRSAALLAFVQTSMVVELICMSSLVALCGVRRIAARLTPRSQRVLCALVPALVAALVVRLMARLDWFLASVPNLTPVEAMLMAALFGLALQHYFELRARAFSPALGEARLQALQARIRPHFLFNSLNAVLALIRSDPRRAETALEDLADLFRVLMRDNRDITSMEDEIRLCRQYLSIETIRLGERLQIEWDTTAIHADVLRQARMPSLLLQPLLENAVYYGVEQTGTPALIRIVLRRARDTIHILITNPYHGNAPVSLGNHMALDNIRGRLRLLYDLEAQLSTTVVEGRFEVRLSIPYVKVDG
ncbi:two-component system sensor histidine kinase AlgZ [Actimicrobium sp. GrIS 1.19]|uniref:sensor histidine kinase n=1 Tax=Actimicrobium sp. GrIS 1.19 TaxID=3071708 RepID=UPI002E0AA2D2|nr:two-component system sensor histidine kinase AlgZ [Actimicrobium sp. GrIS 1.19]